MFRNKSSKRIRQNFNLENKAPFKASNSILYQTLFLWETCSGLSIKTRDTLQNIIHFLIVSSYYKILYQNPFYCAAFGSNIAIIVVSVWSSLSLSLLSLLFLNFNNSLVNVSSWLFNHIQLYGMEIMIEVRVRVQVPNIVSGNENRK